MLLANSSLLLKKPLSNHTHPEKYFGIPFVACVLSFYALILLVGITGNLMTCTVVIIKKSMRRSIHFYTFNLAVADSIILLIYIPTQMKQVWDQVSWNSGFAMCSIVNFVIPLCLSASIFTLIAISVDRYRGFRNPFHWRAESQKNARVVIPIIWVVSIATAIPVTYHVTLIRKGDFTFCFDQWPSAKAEISYWTLMMIIQFILPLVFIAVVHIYMAWRISRSNVTINRLHKRMMTMVIMLLITYSICTGLQHVNYFLALMNNINDHYTGPYLFIFSNLVVSLQAAINPFIYGMTRSDYKDAFRNILKHLIKNVRKIVFPKSKSYVLTASLEPENGTTTNELCVTPVLYRKSQNRAMNNENNLTVKSRLQTLTVPDISTSDAMKNGGVYCNSDGDKRNRVRLNTLAFLDLSGVEKLSTPEGKHVRRHGGLKRLSLFILGSTLTKESNYESMNTKGTHPPQIHITRHESVKMKNEYKGNSCRNKIIHLQSLEKPCCEVSDGDNDTDEGNAQINHRWRSLNTQCKLNSNNKVHNHLYNVGTSSTSRENSESILVFADVKKQPLGKDLQRGSLSFSLNDVRRNQVSLHGSNSIYKIESESQCNGVNSEKITMKNRSTGHIDKDDFLFTEFLTAHPISNHMQLFIDSIKESPL